MLLVGDYQYIIWWYLEILRSMDVPGGPVVKTSSSNAAGTGSIPGWGIKIPHAVLLLLSRFSRVRLCATPWTAAHQAPPSLGFSRQEHWSGLPFPSPMHETEKWKWSCSVVSDSSWPYGLQPTRLLHPWNFPGKSTGVGCHCLLWHTVQYGQKKKKECHYHLMWYQNSIFKRRS